MEGRKIIIIDSREASKQQKILSFFDAKGIKYEIQYLPIGDFYLQGERKNIILERKSIFDFIGSVKSRRMVDQCLGLVSVENAEPRLLVEGSIGAFKKFSKMSDESVVGSLISIQEDWRIPVIFLSSAYWTCIYLERLHADIEGPRVDRMYPLRFKPRVVSMDDKIRCVVEGLEDIGPALSDALLLHFGSIDKLVQASEHELMDVPKIGAKTASKISQILHSSYKS